MTEEQRGDLLIGDEVIAEGVMFRWWENPPEPSGMKTWGGSMYLTRMTRAMPEGSEPLTMRLSDGREARITIRRNLLASGTADFTGTGPPPPALKR